MIRISQIKIQHEMATSFKDDATLFAYLTKKSASVLKISSEKIATLSVSRHSLDARKKPDIFDVYAVDLILKNADEKKTVEKAGSRNISILSKTIYQVPAVVAGEALSKSERPVVVGSGPAGLFCAYILARAGVRPILIERGKPVTERTADVEKFWAGEALNTESNVQFGEGGAGTFSDGKLYTGTNDRDGRQRFVMEAFVRHGADDHILYESNPHIGTDRLRDVISGIREEIKSLGGEIRFTAKLTDIQAEDGTLRGIEISSALGEGTAFANGQSSSTTNDGDRIHHSTEFIKTDILVLAIGHSARDTFEMLRTRDVAMEKKPFAVGLRVAHPQEIINASMYGQKAPGTLPPAPYKLTARAEDGRGVYSFCMCPGGYIVNAASEQGYTCVNGMSYSGRDGRYANSAIVVTVSPDDFGSDDLLSGCAFQREWEKKAFQAGAGKVPVEYLESFMKIDRSRNSKSQNHVYHRVDPKEAIKGLYTEADLASCLPETVRKAITQGMLDFGKKINGFDDEGALFAGVETRTSSPVRIVRGEDFESVNIRGIFPCGEGAGYAGGIMSAATDGIKTAEAVLERLNKKN